MVRCEVQELRVLFAAGGTGGHLFPALSVAQELVRRAPHSKVLFVGTRKGIEASLIPKAGFEIAFISIYGLRRKITVSNIILPYFALRSLFQSLIVMRRFSPTLVFGTGGYVAGPVLLAALLSRVPTLLHEQNSRPGLTALWLARWMSMVLLSYPQSEVYFRRKDHLRITGNPTRVGLERKDHRRARATFGLHPNLDTILVFGGSLGAHTINIALLEAVDELMADETVQLLWQTGERDYEHIKAAVHSPESRVNVLSFIDSMDDAYQAADVVLCRAGATTLAEITRVGLPAILVPYPHATGRHQELNAKILVDAGAAVMIHDHELNGENVVRAIRDLIQNRKKRLLMKNRSKNLGCPQAASDIVEAMCGLVNDHKKADDARE